MIGLPAHRRIAEHVGALAFGAGGPFTPNVAVIPWDFGPGVTGR